jgi:hypothetical protein
MRGSKAKQLRREARRVSGQSEADELEYQITEYHNPTLVIVPDGEGGEKTVEVDQISVSFRCVGFRGYYQYLKRRYKQDIAYRHAWAGANV